MPSVPTVPLPGRVPPDPSPIASTSLSPVLMTGLLVGLLRQHFAAADQAFNPLLRDFYWQPDPAKPGASSPQSPIVIESTAAWDPALVEARPGLFVASLGWRFARLGINNEVMGRFGQDGEVLFLQRVVGGHRVLAVGQTNGGDEGDHLALEAALFLRAALPFVRDRYGQCLARIGVTDCGPTADTFQEVAQHPAAPVTVAYEVLDTWSALADLPRIGRLVLDVTRQIT